MLPLLRRTVMIGGPAVCAAALAPARIGAQTAARPSLPIPAELRADARGMIVLSAQPGTMRFGPALTH